MLRIETLGALNFDASHETSLGFVVSNGATSVLLDPGPYAVATLRRRDQQVPENVFVSHGHFDHCGGVPAIVMDAVLGAASTGSSVVPRRILTGPDVPPLVVATAETYRAAFGEGAHFEHVVLNPGEELAVGDGNMTLHSLTLHHSVPAVGLLLASETSRLLYLPDSALPDDLMSQIAELRPTHALVSCFGSAAKNEFADRAGFATIARLRELAALPGMVWMGGFHGFFPADREAMRAELTAEHDGAVQIDLIENGRVFEG